MEQISTNGLSFTDEYGRERIFHGINVCDKGTPVPGQKRRAYARTWDERVFAELKARGMNLIRFGITWDAVEPEPGKYDDAYLDDLEKILDKCAENGLYVYLDMHQDLFSYFENETTPGDGAPLWACLTEGHTRKPTYFVWGEGYVFDKAVKKSFDNFWKNTPVNGKGIQDYYTDMWLHVAVKLGTHPAVIGFDLMNEPFIGSEGGKMYMRIILEAVKVTLSDPSVSKRELFSVLLNKNKRLHLLDQYKAYHVRKISSKADALVRKFDIQTYTPFLDKTTACIRGKNKNGIIFAEHCVMSNVGIPCSVEKIDDRMAYAPHTYDIALETPMYHLAGTERVRAQLDEARRTQRRLNIPVVFGEWGGGPLTPEWRYHGEYILDTFDEYKWSDTYWAYYTGLFDSEENSGFLNKPYPQAVTGEILSYKHDRENNVFVLEYRQDAAFKAPTEIYAHKKIKAVETDGKVNILPIGIGTGSVVSVTTKPGTHKVVIWFDKD